MRPGRSIRRRAPALLAVLGFVLRALVPVGYMPATLADGGPFVLCHWQNPALVAAFAHGAQADRSHAHEPGAITDALATHAPDGAHDHDASQHDSWSHCPLGVGVAGAPLPVDHHFAFTPPSQAAAQHE